MIETPEGQAWVEYYLQVPYERSQYPHDRQEVARLRALYHYIHIWESWVIQEFPCPVGLILDGPGAGQLDFSALRPECRMCHNGKWEASQQSDDNLGFGFRLYDGFRDAVWECDEDYVNYVLLPENASPQDPADPGFAFDLNPNNNESEVSAPDPDAANFASFELFITEPEQFIEDFVSSIPPSGNRSLKINNDHRRYHINKLEKDFIVTPEDTAFYYWDAVVMQDPGHSQQHQPFTKVVLRHEDNVLYETCVESSADNPDLGAVGFFGQTIVYRDWRCHEVDLDPYLRSGEISPGDVLTAEFIAADCGLGAHWGYMYVADICVECNYAKAELGLEEVCYYCPALPVEFCGSYCFEGLAPGDIQSVDFVIINEFGQSEYQQEVSDVDEAIFDGLLSGSFCFEITEDIYEDIGDGAYDVYIDLTLPDGSVVRSLSATPNSSGDAANDLFLGSDCKENTAIHAVSCVGGTEFENPLLYINGSMFLPDSIELCNGLPEEFEHGLLDLEFIEWPTGLIQFYGTAVITDTEGLLANWGESAWNLELCDEFGDTLCVTGYELDFPESPLTCCLGVVINWDKINPYWSYNTWQTTGSGRSNYLNMMLPFGYVTITGCTIDEYKIMVTYYYGSNVDNIGGYELSGSEAEIKEFFQSIHLTQNQYDANGYFEIIVTSNCGETHTYILYLDGTLSLQGGQAVQAMASDLVALYPNPASDHLQLIMQDGNYSIERVFIIDHTGAVRKSLVGAESAKISVMDIPTGAYQLVIKLENDKGTIYKSFFKE